MRASLIVCIERSVELTASAAFAAAMAFLVDMKLQAGFGESRGQLIALAAAAASFLLMATAFGSVPRARSSFFLPNFDIQEFEFFERNDELSLSDETPSNHELVLTDEDRFQPEPAQDGLDPLILDDVLAQIGPDSRVVHLFDRKAMPTPGELRSQIDHHLGQSRSESAPDASEALSEALAQLRRSLR